MLISVCTLICLDRNGTPVVFIPSIKEKNSVRMCSCIVQRQGNRTGNDPVTIKGKLNDTHDEKENRTNK